MMVLHISAAILLYVLCDGMAKECPPENSDNALSKNEYWCPTIEGNVMEVQDFECGQQIPKSKVENQPTIKYECALEDANYTILMVDPDVRSPYWLHWLAADIPGSLLRQGKFKEGTDVGTKYFQYNKPAPLHGCHRYQFLLYKQDPRMQYLIAVPNTRKRAGFSLRVFQKSNNLHSIARFQYSVQAGS